MASRNITKKFVDLRSAAKANKNLRAREESSDEFSDSGLLNQGGETTNWKALKEANLPPKWVEDIEKTDEDISRIQTKIRELSSLHTKRLMVNFETDEAAQEREIDLITQEITELFRHAEALLKKFSKEDSAAPSSERAVRMNIQRSIAKKLQTLSMSFRTTQKEYMNRLKAQKSESSGMFDFETSNKKELSAADIDMGMTDSQMQIIDDTAELVNERDKEIAHIAKSIEELAQIFKELAVLVIDQGTILDRIDFNMESAVEHAKEGITQLEKAEEHQKNALPFKCVLLLVFLIVVMVIVLIVKHTKN